MICELFVYVVHFNENVKKKWQHQEGAEKMQSVIRMFDKDSKSSTIE